MFEKYVKWTKFLFLREWFLRINSWLSQALLVHMAWVLSCEMFRVRARTIPVTFSSIDHLVIYHSLSLHIISCISHWLLEFSRARKNSRAKISASFKVYHQAFGVIVLLAVFLKYFKIHHPRLFKTKVRFKKLDQLHKKDLKSAYCPARASGAGYCEDLTTI